MTRGQRLFPRGIVIIVFAVTYLTKLFITPCSFLFCSSAITRKKGKKISYTRFLQSLRNFKHSMMSHFLNSSSHYASSNVNYEVFLSFSGQDTRHGFCDHLYHRLDDRGIMVFRDREALHVGQKMDQLLEAIKASQILVPIISIHYASSKWCLMELVQILKCNKPPAQLVLPIFYKVKPLDVREQKCEFGDEFQWFKKKHGIDSKLVQELEQAFKEVASLTIWESDKIADGHEGELVKIVVTRIFNELRKAVPVIADFLVGVEKHVEKIKKKIVAKQSNGASFIVIHGMGGIGKTTLAKVLYSEFSDHYESCSFVPNICEASSNYKGMENLQKQVISDILIDKSLREISHVDEGITIIEKSFRGKRLLLLLDDVGNKDQLNKLAGKHNWFGSDSIIIITTRNRDVVVASANNLSYELIELNGDQSYELFCKHAFGKDASPSSDLEFIARGIVQMTGGLPLALEVIGSLLHGRGKGFWEDTQQKLKKKLNDTVGERLKISYDALTYEQQQIFLDISCLPKKDELEFASYMWKSCDFFPVEGIETLISLSLIKTRYKNKLIMHDQLRDLGRKIVHEEGRRNIGNCSRIWENEKALEMMEQKQGTPDVQALILGPPLCDFYSYSTIHFTSQQFEGMMNLRFLQMQDVRLTGDFENRFPNLKWLDWYPTLHPRSNIEFDVMGINLNPKKLVILNLSKANITEHWDCWSQMKYLKVLKLWICHNLTATPDFSALEGLEVLILCACSSLRKIHPSIGKLRKTLKVLNVLCCKELEKLPIEVGKMEELRELVLDYTSIREIPISKGYMTKLELLSAKGCKRLRYIPDSLSSLVKLQRLELRWSPSLTRIPLSIDKLKSLTKLDLSGTGVRELPDSIGELCNLESLDMSATPIKCLPTSIGSLTKLKQQSLEGCKELESLPNLPSSLVELKVKGCQTLYAFPDLSNMRNLSEITLVDCFGLMEISGLEGAESLVHLRIYGCRKLSRIGDLSHLKMLMTLCLCDCEKLSHVEGIEKLTSLTHLTFSGCHLVIRFLDLSLHRNCEGLTINDEELTEIPGLQELESLHFLNISGCKSLQYLPDFSQLTNLKTMDVRCCEKLTEIQGLENLTSLRTLDLRGCIAFKGIPNLPEVNIKFDSFGEEASNLREVNIKFDSSKEEEESENNSNSLKGKEESK